VDQIVSKIQERIEKRDKKLAKVKPFQIKTHLWIFVNCLVENPTFDSQTKENMTLKIAQFGSECILSDKFIKAVLQTGVVDAIIEEVNLKERMKLNKIAGGTKKSKLTGIPKLEDANEAGTRNSDRCTLILTEGDSAKSLAMAGI
jgi:DNA topoisomerase II